MKEDIKHTLFLFGIAIVFWIFSSAITNPVFVWILKFGLEFGAVLFVLGGIVAVIDVSYRSRNKKNKDNNSNHQ